MRRSPLGEVLLPPWAPTTAILPSGSQGLARHASPFLQQMLGRKSCQALLDLIQQKEREESSSERRAWTHLEKRRPGSRGQPRKVQRGQLWRSSCFFWVEINCRRQAGLLRSAPRCA